MAAVLGVVLVLVINLGLAWPQGGHLPGGAWETDRPSSFQVDNSELGAIPRRLIVNHNRADNNTPNKSLTLELIGQLGGDTFSVATQGNRAYIGLGPRLVVLDVSDSANPVVLGQSEVLVSVIRRVVVTDQIAYVTDGRALYLIDISDSTQPHLISSWQDSSPIYDLAQANQRVYITRGLSFDILDVSDPTSPTKLGSLAIKASNVDVAGVYAYVVNHHNNLVIVDVTDPTQPAQISLLSGLAVPRGITVGNSQGRTYAFIAGDYQGVYVVDVTDPRRPYRVSTHDTAGAAQSVTLVSTPTGDLAYVAAGEGGVQILDISHPEQPEQVAAIASWGNAYQVAVDSNHVLIAAGHRGLRIAELTKRFDFRQAGALFLSRFFHPFDVAVSPDGRYCLIVGGQQGSLHILDISDPSNPIEVGSYDPPGQALGVAVGLRAQHNGAWNNADRLLAYVAAAGYGLRIIDITDATSPAEIGAYNTPGTAHNVVLSPDGTLAFVAAGGYGLRVVDVSDPTRPRPVNSFETPGEAQDIALSPSAT